MQGTRISRTGQGQLNSATAGRGRPADVGAWAVRAQLAHMKTVTAAGACPLRPSAVAVEVDLELWRCILAHKGNLDVEGKPNIAGFQY